MHAGSELSTGCAEFLHSGKKVPFMEFLARHSICALRVSRNCSVDRNLSWIDEVRPEFPEMVKTLDNPKFARTPSAIVLEEGAFVSCCRDHSTSSKLKRLHPMVNPTGFLCTQHSDQIALQQKHKKKQVCMQQGDVQSKIVEFLKVDQGQTRVSSGERRTWKARVVDELPW